MLALPGPQYSLNERICIGEYSAVIDRTSEVQGTGGCIWDAEMILGRYIYDRFNLRDKTVLEIGAGLGLLSIFCKKFGAKRVIATDLGECLPNIQENARRNEVEIEVRELDWSKGDIIEADIILGADLVWIKEILPHLASQLRSLKLPSNSILLCNKIRSHIVHNTFLHELSSSGLSYNLLHQENSHEIAEITLQQLSL